MDFVCGPEWDERIVKINPKRKVGILLSSGVDSTVLFKFIWDNFPATDIRIFNVQTSKNPRKPKIEKILNVLGLQNTLELEIVGKDKWDWPMESHYPRLCYAFQEIRDTTDCEELYCGNILSPHPQFFPRWDVNQKGISKRPWIIDDDFLKAPFQHIEKYHVLDIAKREGFEWLLDHTISCNQSASEPCGHCMGCDELKWGYQQLNSKQGVTLDKMTDDASAKYGNKGW